LVHFNTYMLSAYCVLEEIRSFSIPEMFLAKRVVISNSHANVALIYLLKHLACIFKRIFCTTHQEHTVDGADFASFPYIYVAAMLALLVGWVSECPNM